MNIKITPMTISDYDEVVLLWQIVEGIGLRGFEDSKEGIAFYLDRNPGMSFVARQNSRLVGAVLCGHDGRRGCIYHLAVASEFCKQGIGRTLVDCCLSELNKAGILKCNIVVYANNTSGREIWKRIGWQEREDLVFMQAYTENNSLKDE